MMPRHPAKYTDNLIPIFAEMLHGTRVGCHVPLAGWTVRVVVLGRGYGSFALSERRRKP